jgi:hypothetical protein
MPPPDDLVADAGAIRGAGNLSVKIPIFRGNPKRDTVTVDAWTDTIDRMRGLMGWTEEQTADAAIDAMRDEANVWRENLSYGEDNEKAALKVWTDFKVLFLARFASTKTAVQKVGVILNLKQKAEETTLAFYDRVENATKKVVATERATSNQKTGFTECRKVYTKILFIAYLRPEVRLWVEANGLKNDTTLSDIRQRAIDADDAITAKAIMSGAKAAPMAEIQVGNKSRKSEDQLKEEIAGLNSQLNALGASRGGGRGRGAGGTRGGGRGGASGTQPPKTPAQIAARKRWVLCHKCKQWGIHYSQECRLTESDIAKLVPQSESDQPAGNTYDTQFPN